MSNFEPVGMKPDIKAEWIKRLRSGDYKQTAGTLSFTNKKDNGKSFCCLGVLCEIAADAGVVERIESPNGYATYYEDGNYIATHLLSHTVAAWAGMPENGNGGFDNHDRKYETDALSALNDRGFSFDHIADVIEERF